ncbi:MAG: hypothetical protein GY746_01150, partial [Gammaproteobacteria bacterium]|nr:hypothetical protein [Gammaproteobacteria bacterium]
GDFDTDSVVVNSKLTVTNTVYASAFSSTSPLKLQTNGTTRIYVDDATGNVGVGTNIPETSAILEANSTTKGFLPPRMTGIQRDAISSPVAGLVVWCTNCGANGELQVYNGTAWTNMMGGAAYGWCYDFTDARDSKIYSTVQIGTQCWMAENLAYLPQVDNVADGSEDSPGSYYYVYGYTPNGANEAEEVANAKLTANYTTYGVLYNWPAAMAGSGSSTSVPSGVTGVCPSGWHLPSDAEWTVLKGYLGGSPGGKMKEAGTTYWQSPNTGATNSSGFTALPAGNRYSDSTFNGLGGLTYFWSSTEFNSSNAWHRNLYNYLADAYQGYNYKDHGFSVRCTKY